MNDITDPKLKKQRPIDEIIQAWRNATLNRVFAFGLVIIFPAVVQTFVRAAQNPVERLGAAFLLTSYVLMIAIALWHSLGARLRAMILITVLSLVGIIAMMRGGLAGDGRLYVMIIPILALALLGFRSGIIVAVAALTTYVCFAALAAKGILKNWLIVTDNPLTSDIWLYDGIVLVTLLATAMIILSSQHSYLVQTLHAERRRSHDLRDAYDKVEAEVRSRTEELEKLNDELHHRAHHDALTELPNRGLVMSTLEKAISRARRTQQICALAYVDLDDFKPINDTYGHTQGDLVLKEIAQRLIANTRSTDSCGRLAGDEFAVVLENLADKRSALQVATKLLESIRQDIHIDDTRVSVTASIGLAFYPDDGNSSAELIKNADRAMYEVKKESKNSVRIRSESCA